MAKHDWKGLQAKFLLAHKKTGVKPQDWCEKQKLNYASARRYIKIENKIADNKSPIVINTKANIPTPKNVRGMKHGGYSHYFSVDITTLAEESDLTDELDLCRARIHLVIKTIEEIQRRLDNKEDKPSTEVAASLFDSLFKADIALDKNILRVESITKTLSSIRIDDVNEKKIRADTMRSNEITKATVINAKKSIKQTELIELQVKQARKEAGGTSKLDDYIDDLTGSKVDTVVG